MARVVKDIEIGGRTLKALFDTGSVRSYISAEFRPETTRRGLPIIVGLGGRDRELRESCRLGGAPWRWPPKEGAKGTARTPNFLPLVLSLSKDAWFDGLTTSCHAPSGAPGTDEICRPVP